MCALVTGVQTFALPILITPLAGGFLAQSRDSGRIDPGALTVVTKRAPSEQELADMVFAFRVAKHVKSHAIVYARDGSSEELRVGTECVRSFRVRCMPERFITTKLYKHDLLRWYL